MMFSSAEISESRSRVLQGSVEQGLCGQTVPFYSQGLPSVFIAQFSGRLTFCCSCFIFLRTLNVAKVLSCFALSCFSGSVVVKAADYCLCRAHSTCGKMFFFVVFCFTTVTDDRVYRKIPCVCLYMDGATLQSRCVYCFTHLHNESEDNHLFTLCSLVCQSALHNLLCASYCLVFVMHLESVDMFTLFVH